MNQVSTPYRFVPLSKLVFLPDWAKHVSHDQPFADGVCGELTLRLTCETPLCVGGKQTPSSERAPGKVYFFRTPDHQLAIPGSGLKGMLRNVLEIASFAHFKQVEDQRLGVRDITQSNNFYTTEIVSKPVHSGWLTFVKGVWQIQPCAFSRLHQEALIKHLRVDKEAWKTLKTVRDRYGKIGLYPEIRFDHAPMPKKSGQRLATPCSDGPECGRIVVTGQPGADFERRNAKKYEFVFHDSDAQPLPVPPEVMNGFKQIHEASDEWNFWVKQLEKLPKGIPVFFHQEGAQVRSLGLAMMYKLPYKNSLHDAIRHTHNAHLDAQAPDLSELIFGYLGEDERHGLRGRVNIGMAFLEGDAPRTDWEGPCILNGPKPTFYPAYVRQDGKGKFRQLMESNSELAGWKRYPLKPFEMQYPEGKAADNKKTQVTLETVPAGTTFSTKVRVHNVRRVELGALLWALDFGARAECRHGLGMGKPFGLGQVRLSVEGLRLRANQPDAEGNPQSAEYLWACRREFVDLMNQVVETATGKANAWETSGPLKALFEYAKPARHTHDLQYLPEPKAFLALKNTDALEEVKTVLHAHAPLETVRAFDTQTPLGYASHFTQHLTEAAQVLKKQAEKAELAQRKANASDEEKLLLEIENLAAAYLDSSATGSQKDNLAKSLNKAYDTSMDFSEDEKTRLLELVATLNSAAAPSRKVQQACKKIERDVKISA